MTEPFMSVSVLDGIAIVLLNRPEKLNACDLDEHDEIGRTIREVDARDDVRAIVITGAGRAFSVGGDLALLELINREPDPHLDQLSEAARDVVYAMLDSNKPIVAAVNGPTMGVGTIVALLSDFVIMEKSARLADGHVRAAVSAGDGGTVIWPMLVGVMKAKQYLMTGDWITADVAERLGLITEISDDGASVDRALAIARRLADGPSKAILYTKRSLNSWLRLGMTINFETALLHEGVTMTSAAARTAIERLQVDGTAAIAPDHGGAHAR
ncbi:enoyl-CoA hydratase/isomerase family protein [soil metagenome]